MEQEHRKGLRRDGSIPYRCRADRERANLGLGVTASWAGSWLLPLALGGAGVGAPPIGDAAIPFDADMRFEEVQLQVRTRERVMIRITPFSRTAPPPTVVVPQVEVQRRDAESDGERCIPLGDVVGVRLGQGSELLLHMRDRRVFGTQLERTCQVSSFYSGFYVERPSDGMLCAGREALHARSGGDCLMGTFHEMENGKPAD